MLILLDNLDSFTYNLVSMFQHWGEEIFVFRNQALSAEEIVSMNPEGIVLSPGPGRPAEAGIMPQLIRMALRRRIPLLGVCLGHQGIAEAFGAEIVPAKRVMHGKISRITHTDSGIFAGMPNPFPAVRYHSLAVRGGESACGTGDHRTLGGRRNHGTPGSKRSGGRRSVSSGIGPDGARNAPDCRILCEAPERPKPGCPVIAFRG